MKFFILICVVCVLGCIPHAEKPPASAQSSTRVEKTFHGDVRFNLSERAAIERACQDWFQFSGGRVKLKVIWDYKLDDIANVARHVYHHIIIKILSASDTVTKVDAEKENTVLAWTTTLYGQIWMVADRIDKQDNKYPSGNWWAIAAHELGHAIGLEHACEHCISVMSAQYGGATEFSARDKELCRDGGLCPVITSEYEYHGISQSVP